MYRAVRNLSAPVGPAVDPQVVERHVRLDQTVDSDLIGLYISSATTWVENYLGRSLITRDMQVIYSPAFVDVSPPASMNWYLARYAWFEIRADALTIPRAPVQSVEDVTITHADLTTTTVPDTDYRVALHLSPARIFVPSLRASDTLTVTYRAGYGDTFEYVPAPIRNAICLLSAHLSEHRGDTDAEPPKQVAWILKGYRTYAFGNVGRS